jgi:hypothetical protein
MKQLLFLLLFPCLALAQYQGNGNQKITLGEQTTADGLIWRGVAADTTLTAKSDTAAYFVLDTANLNLYTYKASATGRKWRQLGADTAAIAYVNTYGTQTVNGAKTFTSALTATRFNLNPTANTATGNGMFLPAANTLGFSTNGLNRVTINSNGSFGIGITPGTFEGLTFPDPFFDVAGNMQLKGTAANGFSNLSMGGLTHRKAGIFTSIDGESPYLSFYVASSYNNSNVSLLMYADSLQRLGIGTTSPSSRLVVKGVDGTSSYSSLNVTNSSNASLLFVRNDGNIGIGTTSPANTLSIYGTNPSTVYQTSGTGTGINNGFYVGHTANVSYLYNYNNFPIVLATNNSTRMTIASGGAVTINDLAGTASRAVNAAADGTLSAASSILIKENVENINYGLSDVLKLNPVIFNYIDRNKWGEGKDLGFVAEDVMNVIPEATGVMNNSDIYFDLQKLIPVLTKAIQEQQALIKALEQRIINLENK